MQFHGGQNIFTSLIVTLVAIKLSLDLSRHLLAEESPSNLVVWASWIGELPTAAEVYADASSDVPSGESFDDDDEDEELDASATNEYPDNENDNNDETYDEPEDAQDTLRVERWLGRPREASVLTRKRRDLEDIGISPANEELARPIPTTRRSDDMDGSFNVDDGDEDAWVHDGVDDIQIDPETRRAASELSYDQERNIDAEYEPNGRQTNPVVEVDEDGDPIINRTRITTISEVIPTRVDQDSSKISETYLAPPEVTILSDESQADMVEGKSKARDYLPASQLSFDRVMEAMGQ